jgi:predicted DNA binding CopG/RHH family protein
MTNSSDAVTVEDAPVDPGKSRRVTVVVSEEELRAWKLTAAFRGVSLSEWVRRVLTANAQNVQKGES